MPIKLLVIGGSNPGLAAMIRELNINDSVVIMIEIRLK